MKRDGLVCWILIQLSSKTLKFSIGTHYVSIVLYILTYSPPSHGWKRLRYVSMSCMNKQNNQFHVLKPSQDNNICMLPIHTKITKKMFEIESKYC